MYLVWSLGSRSYIFTTFHVGMKVQMDIIGNELTPGDNGIDEFKSINIWKEHQIELSLWNMVEYDWIQLKHIFEVENHNSKYKS